LAGLICAVYEVVVLFPDLPGSGGNHGCGP
jgi:hypothetical protein